MVSASRRVATLTAVAFLLAGCVRYDGVVTVSPDAKITGTIEYGVLKALASAAGINTLEDLKKQSQGSDDLDSFCTNSGTWNETAAEFVFRCSFSNVTPGASDDIRVTQEGDDLILDLAYNQDSEPVQDSSQKFGTFKLSLSFPGPVTSINDGGTGFARKAKGSDTNVVVQGTASDIFKVKIISSCPAACKATVADPASLRYVKAPQMFGGLVKSNLTFPPSSKPYKITSTVQIPEGITVRIEPGAILSWQKPKSNMPMFHALGVLRVEGTALRPVILTGAPRGYFATNGATANTKIVVRYAVLNGGGAISGPVGGAIAKGESGGDFALSISDSLIKDLKDSWSMNYPRGPVVVERNVFINSEGMRILFDGRRGAGSKGTSVQVAPTTVTIRHNRIQGRLAKTWEGEASGWLVAGASYGGEFVVIGNDFSGVQGNVIVQESNDAKVNARGNFWGTLSLRSIGARIVDGADSFPATQGVDASAPLAAPPQEVPQLQAAWLSYMKKMKIK